MPKLSPLDMMNTDDDPCPVCGSTLFIVDGDAEGKFWLLCVDPYHKGCIHCKDLPDDITVEGNDGSG